jgi:hypothetical protein
MGTDTDSIVRVLPCDNHSLGFRVGRPLVGGFELKRLVPVIALKLCHVKLCNTKNTLYFMHKCNSNYDTSVVSSNGPIYTGTSYVMRPLHYPLSWVDMSS